MSSDYRTQIYYEDVDAGGMVYHSKYLNFCERARSNFFFQKGLSPIDGEFHFVVKHIDADFISPAKFGEVVYVQSKLVSSRKSSLTLEQTVKEEKTQRVIFRMNVQLVYLKQDKISRIPEGLLSIFSEVPSS